MRRLGCFALLLPALAFSVACLPVTLAVRAPVLDLAAATRLLLAADSARAAAFASADPTPLRPLFDDRALAPLLPQLDGLRRHGARIVEEDSSRKVVHWSDSPAGGSGVVQVAGRERVDVRGSAGSWSAIARQWFASLHWSGQRWLVVEARDLPPSQWWHA